MFLCEQKGGSAGGSPAKRLNSLATAIEKDEAAGDRREKRLNSLATAIEKDEAAGDRREKRLNSLATANKKDEAAGGSPAKRLARLAIANDKTNAAISPQSNVAQELDPHPRPLSRQERGETRRRRNKRKCALDYADAIATNGTVLNDRMSDPLLSGVVPVTRALLADVGGTNVRFAIADGATPEPLERVSIRRYRVESFPTFADAARQYLVDIGADSVDSDLADRGYVAAGDASHNPGARPTHAVCAFAGPVMGDEVRMTNHAWTISMNELQRQLGFEEVRAINDFAAMAYSIALLGKADLQCIGDISLPRFASKPEQNFVVLGPGTGLGVSALLLRNGVISALETEAGHVGFAPTGIDQQEILTRVSARFGRVSNERLLCGPGLFNIYTALAEISGTAAESLTPEQITGRADDGSCSICIRAVENFCEMLGAVAGDMALAYAGWDGVYLAGGLTPALLPWLRRGEFRRRFDDKGRYSRIVAGVPTMVITHDEPGLLGAAACALIDAGVDLTEIRG